MSLALSAVYEGIEFTPTCNQEPGPECEGVSNRESACVVGLLVLHKCDDFSWNAAGLCMDQNTSVAVSHSVCCRASTRFAGESSDKESQFGEFEIAKMMFDFVVEQFGSCNAAEHRFAMDDLSTT